MGQHEHLVLRSSAVLLWTSIRQYFDGGLLFLSDDVASLAAVSPGCKCLYELGASCILRLENAHQHTRALMNSVHLAQHPIRACIITSGQLQEASGALMSIIQELPQGTSVMVLTISCVHAHHASGISAPMDNDSALEELAAQWTAQAGTAVGTGYFPLLVKPIGGPGFELVIDDASKAAVAQDLNAAVINDTTHIRQLTADGRDPAPSVQHLAHILSGLRASLSIRPSLFAAGPYAKCVAASMNELHTWPKALPGSSLRPAALVLVDRAADLPAALQPPSSTVGMMSAPVAAEAGTMGSSAATWWLAAVGGNPASHMHATKVLQNALAGLHPSLPAVIAEANLEAAQRSGGAAGGPLLAAAGAAQCARADAEASMVREETHGASAALSQLPDDAVSIARSISHMLESDAGSPRSTILAAVRALLIGCATLRTSLGEQPVAHMDPLDSFVGLYGPDIQHKLATAVERELLQHGGTVRDLLSRLQSAASGHVFDGAAQHGPAAAHAGFAGAHASPAVAVGESSQYARCVHEELLRYDSMSVHASDAGSLSPPSSPQAGSTGSTSVPWGVLQMPGCGRQAPSCSRRSGAVAESSNWEEDWGQGWADGQADGAAAPGDWGPSGWEDEGDWIDSAAVAPAAPAATAIAGVRAAAPPAAPAPAVEKQPEQAASATASLSPSVSQQGSTASGDWAKPQATPAKKKKIVIKKVTKKEPQTGATPEKQSSTATDQAGEAVDGSSMQQQLQAADSWPSTSAAGGHAAAQAAPVSAPPPVQEQELPGADDLWPEGAAEAGSAEPTAAQAAYSLLAGSLTPQNPEAPEVVQGVPEGRAEQQNVSSPGLPHHLQEQNGAQVHGADKSAAAVEDWDGDAWGDDEWGAAVPADVAGSAGGQAEEASSPAGEATWPQDPNGFNQMAVSPQHPPPDSAGSASDGVHLGWAERVAEGSPRGNTWGATWLTKGLESLASQVEAVVMAPPTGDDAGTRHGEVGEQATQVPGGMAQGSWGASDEQWSGWQSSITHHHSTLSPVLGRELGSTNSIPSLFPDEAKEDSLMTATQIPEEGGSPQCAAAPPAPSAAAAAAVAQQPAPHTADEQVPDAGADDNSWQEHDWNPADAGAAGELEVLQQELTLATHDIRAVQAQEDPATPAVPAVSEPEVADAGFTDGAAGGGLEQAAVDEWAEWDSAGDDVPGAQEQVLQAEGSAWPPDKGLVDDTAGGGANNEQGGWSAWEDDGWDAGQQPNVQRQGVTGAGTSASPASPEAAAFAHALLRAVCRAARAASGCGSLLEAIVRAAMGDGKQAAVPGVVSVRSTMGSMLSHGLGALGLAGAEKPLSDFSCVVVIVLGGLTMEEVAAVERCTREFAQPGSALTENVPDVLVGGTSIVHADQIASMLLPV